MFVCRLVNLRQLEWRRREDPFDEDSDPGGSRNGSTEMGSYHTSSTSRYSVPPGAWSTTLSPAADFSNARPKGDIQLIWLRSRSTSSVPTMLTTRSTPAALAKRTVAPKNALVAACPVLGVSGST